MRSSRNVLFLLALSVLMARPAHAASQQGPRTPRMMLGTSSSRETSPSWRLGMGAGIGIPDMFTIDGHLQLGSQWQIRAFYSPPFPLVIRVEMPRDTISTKNNVRVEHPAFNINLTAHYGPQYGTDVLFHPWVGQAFFLAGGLGMRSFNLKGNAKSPIIFTETTTGSSITTDTQIVLDANARTTQFVYRGYVGWFWNLPNASFSLFGLGYTAPRSARSDVKVNAGITSPNVANADELLEPIAEVKRKKEDEMESKALTAMKPIEKTAIPFIHLGFGTMF